MGYLRFILAVTVLMNHAGRVFGLKFIYPWHMPVMMFFVISGFYMQLIAYKYDDRKISDFYASRILRIYPLYFVVLLISLAVPFIFNFPLDQFSLTKSWVEYQSNLTLLAKTFLVFVNLLIVGQEWTLIFSIGDLGDKFVWGPMQGIPLWTFLPVGQAWSLSIEMLFYLLVPFMWKMSNKVLAMSLFGTVLIHFFVSCSFPDIYNSGPHRFFPSALRFFILGMFSARIYQIIDKRKLENKKLKICLLFSMMAHIVSIAISYELSVWLSVFVLPFLFSMFKNSDLDRRFGELSYPIYMSHILVFSIIQMFPHLKHRGTLTFLITLPLAYLLSKYAVAYLDRKRSKYGAGRI